MAEKVIHKAKPILPAALSQIGDEHQNTEINSEELSEQLSGGSRFVLLGEVNPTSYSKDSIKDVPDLLFHASKKPDFHVSREFNYKEEDEVNGATLADGLYATASKLQAENYANRRKGNVVEILPYKARMLDLTAEGRTENLSVPKELLEKWIFFAEPKIAERLAFWVDKPQKWFITIRLDELKLKMSKLLSMDYVDLRKDVLGTTSADNITIAGSAVNEIWREFCQVEEIDGIICVEGGEGEFSSQTDATHLFYNLDKIGTYEDWQSKKQEETADGSIEAVSLQEKSQEYLAKAQRNSETYRQLILNSEVGSADKAEELLPVSLQKIISTIQDAQQAQEVRFELQGGNAQLLLDQVAVTDEQKQAIQEVGLDSLEKVAPGMYIVWMKPDVYSKALVRATVNRARAYKLENGISFVTLQSDQGEQFEQENKTHELQHIAWNFLRQKNVLVNTEQNTHVAESFSIYQDEVIAKMCSGGSLSGYNHLRLMGEDERTKFEQDHPEESTIIKNYTVELNELLEAVRDTIKRTDVRQEDLIWPVMEASNYEELKSVLQNIIHHLSNHSSLKADEKE